MPIVLTAKAMKGCSSGDDLQILASDRAFPKDIEAWCSKTGHKLLDCKYVDGYYEAVVRAK